MGKTFSELIFESIYSYSREFDDYDALNAGTRNQELDKIPNGQHLSKNIRSESADVEILTEMV